MKAVVVLGVLLMSALARAAPVAKVDPPPGWNREDNPLVAERAAQVRDLPGIVRVEFRLWKSPEGDAAFQVLEYEASRNNQTVGKMIDHAEIGAMRGMGSARELSLTRRETGNTVIVDHVVETEDGRLHSRRHYAADNHESFHSVIMTCVGPVGRDVPACAIALESFAWLIKPVSPTTARQIDIAYLVGQLLGYGAMAGLVIWFVVRSIRKKPARPR